MVGGLDKDIVLVWMVGDDGALDGGQMLVPHEAPKGQK